jgi:hypothetical protein
MNMALIFFWQIWRGIFSFDTYSPQVVQMKVPVRLIQGMGRPGMSTTGKSSQFPQLWLGGIIF